MLYKHHAHVVAAYVILSGRDLTGKVSGGQFTLSCTCMLLGKLYRSRANNYGLNLSSSVTEFFGVGADSDEDVGQTVYMLPLMQIIKGFWAEKISRMKTTAGKSGDYPLPPATRRRVNTVELGFSIIRTAMFGTRTCCIDLARALDVSTRDGGRKYEGVPVLLAQAVKKSSTPGGGRDRVVASNDKRLMQ